MVFLLLCCSSPDAASTAGPLLSRQQSPVVDTPDARDASSARRVLLKSGNHAAGYYVARSRSTLNTQPPSRQSEQWCRRRRSKSSHNSRRTKPVVFCIQLITRYVPMICFILYIENACGVEGFGLWMIEIRVRRHTYLYYMYKEKRRSGIIVPFRGSSGRVYIGSRLSVGNMVFGVHESTSTYWERSRNTIILTFFSVRNRRSYFITSWEYVRLGFRSGVCKRCEDVPELVFRAKFRVQVGT